MSKTLINAFQYLFLILLTLSGLLIALNWGDEELKPEAQAILNWQPLSQIFENNGYLTLVGMDAPLDQNAEQVGKQKLETELAQFKQMLATGRDSPAATDSEPTSPYPNWQAQRCEYSPQQNCVDFYLNQDPKTLHKIISAHQVLFNRFNTLKHQANYVEVNIPMISAAIAPYGTLVSAHELQRINAVLAIAENRQAQGVQLLMENAQFSRQLLKNANSLIAHMIALKLVERDSQIVSELLNKYPALAKQYPEQLASALTSIDGAEYSLQQVFSSERNIPVLLLNNLKSATAQELMRMANADNPSKQLFGFLYAKTYQANATVNLIYDLHTTAFKLADAPAHQFNQVKQKIADEKAAYFSDCIFEKYCLKNPIGKILALVSELDYANYVARQHDTEGYIRLVRIQLQLLSAKSTEAQFNQILAQNLNPYTLQPMLHASGVLQFQGQATQYKETQARMYQIQVSGL